MFTFSSERHADMLDASYCPACFSVHPQPYLFYPRGETNIGPELRSASQNQSVNIRRRTCGYNRSTVDFFIH